MSRGKRFSDLTIGDKIFIEHYSYYIIRIEKINGFLRLQVSSKQNIDFKPWLGLFYFIPLNHLKATKVKTQNQMIFLSKIAYKNICITL